MAHFAQLENNTVTRVIVVNNEDTLDSNGVESEAIGQEFCQQFGEGTYLQTSYNNSFRKNYAGVGFAYDPVRDAFIAPEPPDAIGFDEETCRWIRPAVESTKVYNEQDEETLSSVNSVEDGQRPNGMG
jgi:hypothetical protein